MSQRTPVDPTDAYVLVVEDNLQNTLLISRILDHIGVRQYEWKASGWQLAEIVEKMPQVDLILLDLHLPHEDGFEVLDRIRSDPYLCNALVIAITADASPETMRRTQKAGFDGFIGKPINLEKMPGQISDILQGKMIWDVGYP